MLRNTQNPQHEHRIVQRLRSSVPNIIPFVPIFLDNEQSKIEILNSLINNTDALCVLVPSAPHVFVTTQDQNSSARSLIFGVLITASIAIKNPTSNLQPALEALSILHKVSLELKYLYEQGWGKLEIQSKAFPRTCNGIIELIQAIRADQIQTTELILLACEPYSPGSESSMSLAFTDLSNYLLYLEAKEYTGLVPDASDKTRVRLIRDQNTTAMTDLLQTSMPYNALERSLVCNRLKIFAPNIDIDDQGTSRLTEEALANSEVSFITVSTQGHTALLLDKRMIQQIKKESRFQHRNLEACYLDTPGIEYHPVLDPENRLHALNISFIQLCNEANKLLAYPNFPQKFNQLCKLFLEHIRPLSWQLYTKDVLCELEKTIYSWQTKIVDSTPVLEENKEVIQEFLKRIYIGNIEPLLVDSDEINLQFFIGGINNNNNRMVNLGQITVDPLQHQQLTIFIEGINRTTIHARSPDFKQQLDASLIYLLYLTQLNLITFIDKDSIKQAMSDFYQAELDSMPQHNIAHNQPGYEASLQEKIQLDKILNQFNKALNSKGLESISYKSLLIREINNDLLPQDDYPNDWPSDLDAFEQSIEPNSFCNEQWEHRFSLQEKKSSNIAATYFSQIRDLMDEVPNNRRLKLALKLADFAAHLKLRSNYFEINMMLDVAKQLSSSQNSSLFPYTLSEYSHHSIHTHPKQIHEPVQGLSNYPEIKEKSDPELLAKNLAQQLQSMLNTRTLNEAIFETHFNIFRTETKQFLTDYRLHTESLLIDYKKVLHDTPLTWMNSHYIKIETYIERIRGRHMTPLPRHIENEMSDLIASYQNSTINSRALLKAVFLTTLKNQIIENPADSYAECIQRVSEDTEFKDLFRHTYSHFFFGTNKLAHFLQRLKDLDPKDENIENNCAGARLEALL